MLSRTSQKIKEQDGFILFYERPHFEGDLYIIPCDVSFSEKKKEKTPKRKKEERERMSGQTFLDAYPFAFAFAFAFDFAFAFAFAFHHRFSCFIPSNTRMILKGRLPAYLTKVSAPDLVITEGYHDFLHIPFAHITEIQVTK